MVTALSLMRGIPSSGPLDRDDRVMNLARWLAHQRAVPVHQVESTALEIATSATPQEPLEGPSAPLVVQPRGALWLIGKLGGRALLHIFSDQESAVSRAKELGDEEGVAVIVIGLGGDIAERWRPASMPAPASPPDATARTQDAETATPPSEAASPTPMSTAPAAPVRPASTPLAPAQTPTPSMVAHLAQPAHTAPSPVAPTAPTATTSRATEPPAIPLEVRRHESGWAVMLRGQVIATAPTREKARLRKKALEVDPDFVANPRPDAAG